MHLERLVLLRVIQERRHNLICIRRHGRDLAPLVSSRVPYKHMTLTFFLASSEHILPVLIELSRQDTELLCVSLRSRRHLLYRYTQCRTLLFSKPTIVVFGYGYLPHLYQFTGLGRDQRFANVASSHGRGDCVASTSHIVQ